MSRFIKTALLGLLLGLCAAPTAWAQLPNPSLATTPFIAGQFLTSPTITGLKSLSSQWSSSAQFSSTTQPLALGLNAMIALPLTGDIWGTTAVGSGALQSLTATSTENTAVGTWACQNMTTGTLATCLGMHAGGAETSSPGIVVIGNDALRDAITFNNLGYVVAIGQHAIAHGQPDQGVMGLGAQALRGHSTAVLLGGSLTNGDTVSITVAASGSTPASVTGLPQTVNHLVAGGDTFASIATDLASKLSALSIQGPSFNFAAIAKSYSDGTAAVSLQFPGSQTTGWALTTTASASGAATETTTIISADHPLNTVVIGANAVTGEALNAPTGITAVGDSAGRDLAGTAGFHALFGDQAGLKITTGQNDSIFGSQAGNSITAGNRNSIFGTASGKLIAGGSANSIFGDEAGQALTSGANYSIFGKNVGNTTCATGSNDLLLGTSSNTDCTSGAEANAIHIGAGGADIITVTGAGTNTTAVMKLHGSGLTFSDITTGTNADVLCVDSSLIVRLQAAASCTISSMRFKHDIEPVSAGRSLENVLRLRPATFYYNDGEANADKNAARLHIGLIAEDVARVDRRLAIYEPDMETPKSWHLEGMIAELVGAVQAQQKEIEAMRGYR